MMRLKKRMNNINKKPIMKPVQQATTNNSQKQSNRAQTNNPSSSANQVDPKSRSKPTQINTNINKK